MKRKRRLFKKIQARKCPRCNDVFGEWALCKIATGRHVERLVVCRGCGLCVDWEDPGRPRTAVRTDHIIRWTFSDVDDFMQHFKVMVDGEKNATE